MSEDTADTATEVTETVAVVTETTTDDHKAEAEKWKAQARKHEDRAKANANAAKELEKLKEASMSDLEKAVNVARLEARTEALREVGTKLVDSEVRAAATGRGVDVDALLEGLDRSRFLDDDGEPDRAQITAWVDRIAPDREEPGFPDLGQGTRPPADMGLGSDPLYQSLKKMVGS